MTRRERVSFDLHVTFDLIRHLLEHPDEIDAIPDHAVVQVVSPDRLLPRPVPGGVSSATFVGHRSFRRVETLA